MTRLYDRKRWKRRRVAFLRAHPLCRFCEETSRVTLAVVVDHKTPHKGDETLFWDQSNWQGLCKRCHDGAKKELENTGRIRGCDVHGRPLDPDHHWNRDG